MSHNGRPNTLFLCEQDNYACSIQEVHKYGGCPICLMRRKMQLMYISEGDVYSQAMDVSESEDSESLLQESSWTCEESQDGDSLFLSEREEDWKVEISLGVPFLCLRLEELAIENY